ncbi:WD domain, G-beta repeat [Plasmodiophora brassicae]
MTTGDLIPPCGCAGRVHLSSLLHEREAVGRDVYQAMRDHRTFAKRLAPAEVTLEDRIQIHHTGCVNRLHWYPKTGHVLASVSDDRTVRLWSVDDGSTLNLQHTIQTEHHHNILGVRFLNAPNEMPRMATGAMDHAVCITNGDQSAPVKYRCHRDFVIEIEQSLDQPSHVFWSASKDGTVRQWDDRLKPCGSLCTDVTAALSCQRNVLIDQRRQRWEFRAVSAMPFDSNLIVTASGIHADMWDRRMLSLGGSSSRETVPVKRWVARHLVRHGNSRVAAITSVNISPSGKRIVLNYNPDDAFVFDVNGDDRPVDSVKPCDQACTCAARLGKRRRRHSASRSDQRLCEPYCLQLKTAGNEKFHQERWLDAIGLYSKALLRSHQLSPQLRATLLTNRSTALLKRRWVGDLPMALSDAERSLELLTGEAESVSRMGRAKAALRRVQALAGLHECEAARRLGIQYAKEYPDIATHLARAVSDTSDRRRFLVRDDERPPSPATQVIGSSVSRLAGHCNFRTSIKEATFLSEDIVGVASDCGSVFVYDAESAETIALLEAGENSLEGLNCVRAHPALGVSCVATSGLDHHIQLFAVNLQRDTDEPRDRQFSKLLLEDLVERNQDTLLDLSVMNFFRT